MWIKPFYWGSVLMMWVYMGIMLPDRQSAIILEWRIYMQSLWISLDTNACSRQLTCILLADYLKKFALKNLWCKWCSKKEMRNFNFVFCLCNLIGTITAGKCFGIDYSYNIVNIRRDSSVIECPPGKPEVGG